MVRSIFEPLQLVPDCVGDLKIQNRAERLLDFEGHDSLPARQATPRGSDQANRESASSGSEKRRERRICEIDATALWYATTAATKERPKLKFKVKREGHDFSRAN